MLKSEVKEAWSWTFVGHALLVKRIDQAMQEAKVVSLDVYDLLLSLELEPGQQMKMCSLADRVLLSRSGLTRLVDRLVEQGLIERVGCQEDRRSTYARLTDTGLKERERAWPVFRDQIDMLFQSQLKEGDAECLSEIYKRIVDSLEWRDDLPRCFKTS